VSFNEGGSVLPKALKKSCPFVISTGAKRSGEISSSTLRGLAGDFFAPVEMMGGGGKGRTPLSAGQTRKKRPNVLAGGAEKN
jgi:hypothetical protein